MNESNQPNSGSQTNRRDFLKTTSAIVGGSILGGLSIERSAFAASDDTLKIALIGCGGRGSGAADHALNAAGKAKIVAMADAFPHRLKASLENLQKAHPDQVDVPEDHQFTGFDAYLKAIALADVVILATPPGFRPIHFEAAVAAGKHVFMEKPVAVDAPGVRKVLAAAEIAKQKNLKVAVGLQRRHQPAYIETMKRLHDGAIGDIVSMRCYWDGQRPWLRPRKAGASEMEFQMDNWYYFTWLCGDHILEQHIHNLDVINWMKQGYPVKAIGMGGCQSPRNSNEGEIFDHHAVEFEYADGSRLYSQCRHIKGCWDSVSEHAVGTRGSVDTADGGAFIIKGPNAWQNKEKQKMSPWQAEHYPLFDAIRNDKPYNEAEYGARSTMTAIMGRMATYSGKQIEWNKALNSELSLGPDVYAWDAKPKPQLGADGLYPMPMPGDPEWLKENHLSPLRIKFFAALILAVLTGCQSIPQNGSLARFEFTEPHMGTLFSITLYAPDQTSAKAAADAAFHRVADLEHIMTDYDPRSELRQLCLRPVGEPTRVSPELFYIIKESQRVARETGGAFDITVGPYVHAWRIARKTNVIPSAEELARLRQRIGYEKLRLDARSRSVILLVPNMELDLGGIGKGYAADEALAVMRRRGIPRALVAASGDIAIGDAPPGKAGWKVGIQSMDGDPDELYRTVILHNAGISTSGDTEQNVQINGVRYSHIIDPATGLGLTNRIQDTIIGPNATITDGLDTPIGIMGVKGGLALIDSHPELAAIIVTKDAEGRHVFASRQFQRRFGRN